MSEIFFLVVHQPLYNALIFFYNEFGKDFGIAIILTTLLIKFLFIPLSKKQIEAQAKMQELQPKIKEIQQKYKTDKERQTKELMQFYKENKVNPFAGCLPILVQIVFLIAIYRILMGISQAGFVANASELYSFVENPGSIKHLFVNFIDLTTPNIVLGVFAALAQYVQIKMMMKKQAAQAVSSDDGQPDFAAIMNKQMLIIGPGLTLFVGATFPAALSLYWLVSTLFMILQQRYIMNQEEKAKSETV